MPSDPAPTRLEPTRATAQDPGPDSRIADDATILGASQRAVGATLIQSDSHGTSPESSAGDFQLSFYFAQQAADEASDDDTELHGARCPRFGRFVLLELLGRGGMGEVYRALHVRLRKQAAIKLLPLERAVDPQARERFRREISIISELKHPNIVRLENAGEIDGVPYLVMEYIPGLDLEQLVARLGPLPVPDACQLVGQAAIGLSHIHQQGLVHRDLKPGNLILSTDGALKIADLGLARLAEGNSEITAEGVLVGDPHYMAPEQVDGTGPVDIRSDIYALGCTLFTLLTGRPPFADAAPDPTKVLAAHLYQPFPTVTEHRNYIPGGLAKILSRMTARQPSKRFTSPGEVAAALALYARGCDPVGLLDRLDIVPRAKTRPADTTVGSAEYLSSSGEFRRTGSRLRWLTPVAGIVAGVLLTVCAFLAFNLLHRDQPGEPVVETPDPGASIAESDAEALTPIPADWRDTSKDQIDEHRVNAPPPTDILTAINARRDTFGADVSSTSDGIVLSTTRGRGLLQLPVQPPRDYRLDMVVERLAGDDSLGIGVNAGSGRLLALIDHGTDPATGLMYSDGSSRMLDQQQGERLPLKERVRIQLNVSPTEVCLRIEDSLSTESGSPEATGSLTSCWSGDPAVPELSNIDAYYPGVLFLHVDDSSFHIHELTVTEPNGQPATLLFDAEDTDEHRLAKRILWRGGRVNLLTADGESWEDRLQAIPEEAWIVGIEPRESSPSLHLNDEDLAEIAGSTLGLKRLDLRSSRVTDDGLAYIDGMSSLEWLGLSGKHLTGMGLSRIEDPPPLKIIYLNTMSIGDGLPVLTRFPTLTQICLSHSRVTDAGVMQLADAFRDLHHLCLNYTDINGDCLPSLMSFRGLEELNLRQTHVRDEDLEVLAQLPALTSIDLEETKVSRAGLERLLQQLEQRNSESSP